MEIHNNAFLYRDRLAIICSSSAVVVVVHSLHHIEPRTATLSAKSVFHGARDRFYNWVKSYGQEIFKSIFR